LIATNGWRLLGARMIYNDAFVWLHFPKCAGTKVERLFEKYFSGTPGLHQDIVDPTADPESKWHDSLAQREKRQPGFDRPERTVICSVRRLTSWLVSRYSFEVKRSPELAHRPELLLKARFLLPNGREGRAEKLAKLYLPRSVLKKRDVRFIRTEYFADDFRHVFSEFVDVSVIPQAELETRVNPSKNRVPRPINDALRLNPASVYATAPTGNE